MVVAAARQTLVSLTLTLISDSPFARGAGVEVEEAGEGVEEAGEGVEEAGEGVEEAGEGVEEAVDGVAVQWTGQRVRLLWALKREAWLGVEVGRGVGLVVAGRKLRVRSMKLAVSRVMRDWFCRPGGS